MDRRILLVLLIAGCSPSETALQGTEAEPCALPAPRHGHRIVRLEDGTLLAFGGFSDDQRGDRGSRETWSWTAASLGWQRRVDLNHPHSFFGSAVLDGVAYAIGSAVERYDAARDRWEVVVPPGRLPKSHLAATSHEGALWVLGGLPVKETGFFRIDPRDGSVTARPPPPGFQPGDHLPFLFSMDKELHALGGMRDEILCDHFVLCGESWVPLPPSPLPLWAKFGAHSASADGATHHFFGDFGGLCLDARTGTFSACAAPPFAVAMPAAVRLGSSIYWIGGRRVGQRRPVLLRYDIADDRWNDLCP